MFRVIRIFRWAASEELIPVEVHQALATVESLKKGRTTAPEPKPIMPVELEIVDRTMEHLCDVVRDMIRVQWLTGMRPGEVCNVRPCDIDRSTDVWEYRLACGGKYRLPRRLRSARETETCVKISSIDSAGTSLRNSAVSSVRTDRQRQWAEEF